MADCSVSNTLNKANRDKGSDLYILGEKEPVAAHGYSESGYLVRNFALQCKTLEGFAGAMRKYCPDRRGSVFSEVFIDLLEAFDKSEGEKTVGRATKTEKFIALLKNQVSTATSTKAIYEDMQQCGSLPSIDERIRSLQQFIDEKEVEEIGLQNRGRLVVYCRKTLMEDRTCSRKRNYRFFLHPVHEDSS